MSTSFSFIATSLHCFPVQVAWALIPEACKNEFSFSYITTLLTVSENQSCMLNYNATYGWSHKLATFCTLKSLFKADIAGWLLDYYTRMAS